MANVSSPASPKVIHFTPASNPATLAPGKVNSSRLVESHRRAVFVFVGAAMGWNWRSHLKTLSEAVARSKAMKEERMANEPEGLWDDIEDEELEQALNGVGTDQPNGVFTKAGDGDEQTVKREIHEAIVGRLCEQKSLLELKLAAQEEIIAAYRDALECFQNEKRLASSLHLADIAAITKPKTT